MINRLPRSRQAIQTTSMVGMLGGFCTKTAVECGSVNKSRKSSWKIWYKTLNGAYSRNMLRGQRQQSLRPPPHHGAGERRNCLMSWERTTSSTQGSPRPPMSETVKPAFANDTAWYCMRGDRPRSPSTTTATFFFDMVLFYHRDRALTRSSKTRWEKSWTFAFFEKKLLRRDESKQKNKNHKFFIGFKNEKKGSTWSFLCKTRGEQYNNRINEQQ